MELRFLMERMWAPPRSCANRSSVIARTTSPQREEGRLTILKGRLPWAAVGVGLAILLLGLVVRPLWRDEYWALYFSGAEMSLTDAINLRMARDVHPPIYFIILHFWRLISDAELWARLINLVVLPLSAFAVWRMGQSRRDETALFLFACAGSYWVIYFGIEARMYALVFGMCAITVLAVRNALVSKRPGLAPAAIFAIAGAVAGGSHFFAAAWCAMLGFFTGVAFLRRGRLDGFVLWGAASVIAIAPAALWILRASPQDNPGAEGAVLSVLDALAYGGNQFLRGLVVKTFGSNLALFIGAILCAPLLIRKRDPFDAVLSLALLGTVLMIFAIHLFMVPMIKERGFIAIMPGVIYLLARAVLSLTQDDALQKKRAAVIVRAIPIVALISPFLFLGEYFKDREQLDEVRALIADSGQCAAAPVVMSYRPSEQAQDFHPFMLAMALRGAANGEDLQIVDARDIIAGRATLPGPNACPIRALALVMPKGDGPQQHEARAELRAAGVPLDDLNEIALGKGRSLVWAADP